MAKAYIVVYLLVGLAAALTWIIKGDAAIEYLRTLATAWGGMFLGIGQGFFRANSG